MLLEFSSPHFQPLSESVAIRFLHQVSNAQLSPEMIDSSDSRDGMPQWPLNMTNTGYLRSSEEINNLLDDTLNSANIEGIVDQSVPAHYRECMKNHAATLGRQSVDGCGEFLPSGSAGLDAFKCAACSCHRSFHRREVEGNIEGCCMYGKGPKRPSTLAELAPSPTSTGSGNMLSLQHPPLEDPNGHTSHKKKRHRTIFTLDQKEKMFYFAESLGWKISKHDEEFVQSFCDDVGVSRRIFKVWMHNHKHDMKRQ